MINSRQIKAQNSVFLLLSMFLLVISSQSSKKGWYINYIQLTNLVKEKKYILSTYLNILFRLRANMKS